MLFDPSTPSMRKGCDGGGKKRKKTGKNTSLAAKGALANRLQNPKWPPGGPKMAEGVWKGVYP